MIRASFTASSALAAFVVVFALAQPLRAEPAKDGATNPGLLAVQKGDAGIALYANGQWDEALRAFTEAELLSHSPVFLLYQARSLRNAGRMLEAQTILRRLTAEVIAPDAPEPWKRAQADGRLELARLEQDVPSIVIAVKGASPRTTITLDGTPVIAGQRIELDPGEHLLVGSDGAHRAEQAFTVVPGTDPQHLVLTLNDATVAPELLPQRDRGPYLPGIIVAGVGGAALIAGTVVGAIANAKASTATHDLPAKCQGTTCLPSTKSAIEPRFESARTLATTADALLIGGATVAVVGVVLWILDPRGEPAVATQVSAHGGSVRLWF